MYSLAVTVDLHGTFAVPIACVIVSISYLKYCHDCRRDCFASQSKSKVILQLCSAFPLVPVHFSLTTVPLQAINHMTLCRCDSVNFSYNSKICLINVAKADFATHVVTGRDIRPLCCYQPEASKWFQQLVDFVNGFHNYSFFVNNSIYTISCRTLLPIILVSKPYAGN